MIARLIGSLSLRARLTIWYSLALVAVLGLFGAVVVWQQGRIGLRRVERELDALASTLDNVLRDELAETSDQRAAAVEANRTIAAPDRPLAILDADGAVLAAGWHGLTLGGPISVRHELQVWTARTAEGAWRTIETMKLISPGICVRFEPRGEFENPLCGQSKGIGRSPPLWFAAAVQTLFGTHAAVARSVSTRNVTAGTVSAVADPDAAISLAWQHIADNIHVALLMALAIAFFASLAIAHTLAPAQQIVAALQRMAHGQYRTSLPRFRSMELAMIGQAVGDLGERLAQATEERAVLTRRLLEIRNDERRALARPHERAGRTAGRPRSDYGPDLGARRGGDQLLRNERRRGRGRPRRRRSDGGELPRRDRTGPDRQRAGLRDGHCRAARLNASVSGSSGV